MIDALGMSEFFRIFKSIRLEIVRLFNATRILEDTEYMKLGDDRN